MSWSFLSALAGPAVAQVQPGRALVVDSATSIPLVGANVALREGTLAVVSQRTNDSGFATLRAPRSGAFTLEVRAIGFASQLRQVQLDSGETITGVFKLSQIAVHLDTVTTRDARAGLFGLTPGREFYRRHFERGIGQFISGLEIQFSKLGLITFLGTIPGLERIQWVPLPALRADFANTPPTIAGRDGFLLSTLGHKCLYGRIDHWPLPTLLDFHQTPFLDDVVSPEDVMGVEVYMPAEVPPEWNFFGVQRPVVVSGELIAYLTGHSDAGVNSGRNPFRPDPRERASNAPMSPSREYVSFDLPSMVAPRCAFVQIWTRIAW